MKLIENETLFDDLHGEFSNSRPVNVASVPQRSPFRYPGGKTWLVPQIRKWLSDFRTRPQLFVEPFAGGGIVSLTVAAEELADQVVMVELDSHVAAVWRTILNPRQLTWLTEQITNFDIGSNDADSIRLLVEAPTKSVRQQAFQTIVKNRTYHGGILAAGSAPIKHGENGKGLASRWYPETLRKRIRAIGLLRKRIAFIEGDGLKVMLENKDQGDAVFFIDPPYTASGKSAGRRLYREYQLDHQRLFEISTKLKGDFLMTYDNSPEVIGIAESFGLQTMLIPMKNTHNAEMTELLIGRNLDWVRS